MGLGTWLAALAGPLAIRVVVALGFSIATVTGVTLVLDTLKAQFVTSLLGLPAAGIQLLMLAGFNTAIGIIFGAIATRVLMWQWTQATKFGLANTGS